MVKMIYSMKYPVSVHFIWHPSEKELPLKIMDGVQNVLFKKNTSDFSGCNEIPFFFYCSSEISELPTNLELQWSEKNIVFFFSGSKLVVDDKWKGYLHENIGDCRIGCNNVIPIFLDDTGKNLPSELSCKNGIRLCDFEKDKIDYGILSICQEIQRRLKENGDSLKIFLSHCKRDDNGLTLVKELNSFVYQNLSLRTFFDVTEIRPGYDFVQEIDGNLGKTSLMVIHTDDYSLSYWCQHEINYAKEIQVPIIVVDALDDYTDRYLTALANVPSVRLDLEKTRTNHDLFSLLISVLVETIRCNYIKLLVPFYQDQGWIPKEGVKYLIRPPEIKSVVDLEVPLKQVCYPEPRVFIEEEKWLENIGIKIISMFGNFSLEKMNVGISISDCEKEDQCFFRTNHIPYRALTCFSRNLARQLVQKGIQLIYGGDFRKKGFTNTILKEIEILAKDDENIFKDYRLSNYLAWPLFNDHGADEWYAKNAKHLIIERCFPDGVDENNKRNRKDLISVEDKFLYSKSLSNMREKSISQSDVRICAGGKVYGYSGKMPGVLEEILIAIKMEKPLFLVGCFEGMTQKVCDIFLKKDRNPIELTSDWQEAKNEGYAELQKYARNFGDDADYKKIVEFLNSVDVSDLAHMAGLSLDDYKRVMVSPFIDEIIHLVLKGLSKIQKREG